MRDEQIALSTQLNGAGSLTLRARMEQARSWQVQGLSDKAIATLEPLMPQIRQHSAPPASLIASSLTS